MDTWWIDAPHILGSENPTSTGLEKLSGEGFTILICLLDEDAQAPRYDATAARTLGFVRHTIPVKDRHAPTINQLNQFMKLLDALPESAKTIVHCEGGIGRTGTFAAAYWVAKGMSASDAIARVRQARPGALETPEQEHAVAKLAAIISLGDYLALVYHEARNVRHLIRARAIEPERWKFLVALPVKRHDAWQALQGVRSAARQVDGAAEALQVFERRFRVSLAQLVTLYGNPGWRNAPYGGNAWEEITRLVETLATCLEAGRVSEADRSLQALHLARHNTGLVVDKLVELDRAAGLGRGK